MFCKKCGKENSDSNSFCEFCGNQLTENLNREAEIYFGQNPIDKETQAILEEKKRSKTKKCINNMDRFSSVMWLIAGIMQIIIGIKSVCDLIQRFSNGFGSLDVPLFISYVSLTATMLIMGYINIAIFCESKNKCIIWNRDKIVFPIALLSVYVIMFIVMFALCLEWYFAGRINFIIFVAPIIAAITDIIKIAVKESKKDVFFRKNVAVPKTSKVIFVIVTLLVGVAMIISSVFTTADYIVDSKLDKEKEKAITTVKAGHLDGYPNKTVMDVIEYLEYSEGFNFSDWWSYIGDVSRDFTDILLGKKSEICHLSTIAYNYANEKTQTIKLEFEISDGLVSIETISKNDKVLNSEEKAEWIDDYFGNGLLEKRGKKYVKNGMYISNTQKLYSAPNYNSTTTTTYKYSGDKNIHGYEISEDGKTLWLKINVNINGVSTYYYVPETY